MKLILVLSSLFIILLASGCVSIDPEAIAKASPIVQSFLADYPNAQIRIVSYSGDQVQSVLDQYITDCNKTSIPADIYKIDITDLDSGLSAAAWIDKSDMSIDCAIKRSMPLPNSTYCDSHAESKCHGGHVYWFDSCGNKEDKKELCDRGCEENVCIDKGNCTVKNEMKCKDGHVYWYDSCGVKGEKKQYCNNGCSEGECIGEPSNETSCTETDSGYDIYEKGTTTVGSQSLSDHCNADGSLTEKFCDGNTIKYNSTECPTMYVCNNGACKIELNVTDPLNVTTCTDSDSGIDYYNKGTVDYVGSDGVAGTMIDFCESGRIYEYSCDVSSGYKYLSHEFDCEYGCENGACITNPTCGDGVCGVGPIILLDYRTSELAESQSFVYDGEDYEVDILGISDSNTAVITVNGVSKSLDTNTIHTVDGIDVFFSEMTYFKPYFMAIGNYPQLTNNCDSIVSSGYDLSTGEGFDVGDSINDEVTTLTKTHLPTILADGEIESLNGIPYTSPSTYTQKIVLGQKSITYGNSGGDLDLPTNYLDIGYDSSSPFYTYVLEFTPQINFSDPDVHNKKINLGGIDYLIDYRSGNIRGFAEIHLNEIVIWDIELTEGQTTTANIGQTELELFLLGVASETQAVMRVNGVSKSLTINSLNEGYPTPDTFEDGEDLMVLMTNVDYDPDPNNISSIKVGIMTKRINIGDQMKLQKESDNVNQDGTFVTVDGDGNALSKIEIAVAASDSSSDYMVENDNFVDRIFGLFTFYFDLDESICRRSQATFIFGETSTTCPSDCV